MVAILATAFGEHPWEGKEHTKNQEGDHDKVRRRTLPRRGKSHCSGGKGARTQITLTVPSICYWMHREKEIARKDFWETLVKLGKRAHLTQFRKLWVG